MKAFLYARSNSRRLPNKCFKNIYGSCCLIEHMIQRTKLAFKLEDIYYLHNDDTVFWMFTAKKI